MKILLAAHSFFPDCYAGTEVYTYNLARTLLARHDVRILYAAANRSDVDPKYAIGEYEEIPTYCMVKGPPSDPRGPIDIDPGARKVFRAILEEMKPDLVHFQHLLHLSADLVDEAALKGIPTVLSLHDYWYLCMRVQLYIPGNGICSGPSLRRCRLCFQNNLPSFSMTILGSGLGRLCRATLDRLTRICFPRRGEQGSPEGFGPHLQTRQRMDRMRATLNAADMIIANSRHTLNRYLDFGMPPEKCRILPYGMDKEKLGACRHGMASQPRFSYMGSIVEHKGVHLLMEVFRRVPQAELRIWGNPEATADVRRYTASMNPPSNVYFMGGYDYQDLESVLKRTDVLIVPSLWEETYGIVVDEARLGGIPVLASRIGALPEHLTEGKEGFFFDPGNVDQLAELVRWFFHGGGRWKPAPLCEVHVPTLDQHAHQVEEIYRQLIRGKPWSEIRSPPVPYSYMVDPDSDLALGEQKHL